MAAVCSILAVTFLGNTLLADRLAPLVPFSVERRLGDVAGSGALIFAARSVIDAAYSRDAEQNADDFAVEVMRPLSRSPKPMGELLLRVTGAEGDKTVTILANHPLTEDRLADITRQD